MAREGLSAGGFKPALVDSSFLFLFLISYLNLKKNPVISILGGL